MIINGLSNRQDATTAIRHPAAGFKGSPGRGSCCLFLAATFSAIDWGMSLDPKWTSTIYGVMIIIGDALATLALMIVVAGFLAADRPMSRDRHAGSIERPWAICSWHS